MLQYIGSYYLSHESSDRRTGADGDEEGYDWFWLGHDEMYVMMENLYSLLSSEEMKGSIEKEEAVYFGKTLYEISDSRKSDSIRLFERELSEEDINADRQSKTSSTLHLFSDDTASTNGYSSFSSHFSGMAYVSLENGVLLNKLALRRLLPLLDSEVSHPSAFHGKADVYLAKCLSEARPGGILPYDMVSSHFANKTEKRPRRADFYDLSKMEKEVDVDSDDNESLVVSLVGDMQSTRKIEVIHEVLHSNILNSCPLS
jgi:hypothetical protein